MRDDVTGDILERRKDDDPEILMKRLDVYDNETRPVLQFYKDKGILNEFVGNSSNEIWSHLKVFLEKELRQRGEKEATMERKI